MKAIVRQVDQQIQHQKQVTKQSLLANDFDWIIEPQKHKHHQYGGLGLGNIKFAQNQRELKKNQIGAVVSVFGEKSLFINPNIKHFRILISDNSSENIKCFFNTAYLFIKQHLAHTNVFVHCQAGVSRSTTIVASYLMKENGMNADNALDLIRLKRPHICPNKGFIKQLRQYQKDLADQHAQSANSSCQIM